jgi:lipopolysaccharide export system permease protein
VPGLNLVDRYLLREWLKVFGLVLFATLGLLLVAAMYDDLSSLLDQQAKVGDVLFYYAIKLPGYFAFVLPLAMLLSLLYTLGQLHRHSEITALRAAGLGIFRITRIVWVAGIFFAGLMWWFNASIIPWSVRESRNFLLDLTFLHETHTKGVGQAGLRFDVAFDNQVERRVWFFNRYNPVERRGYAVSVVELDALRRETNLLLAHEAEPDPAGGWVFRDGTEIAADPATGDVRNGQPFKLKKVASYHEDPALMLLCDLPPAELSLPELDTMIDYYHGEGNPKVAAYQVRYFGLLADAMAPFIVILLAVPFATTGVRVNPVVGVTKSLGLFLLYFTLVRTSYAFGGDGLLDPLWAALLPNLTMFALGLFLFVRAR